MKRASAFLALWMLFFAGLALANTATLTAIIGTAQAQTGTAPARALRVGDLVRQGDTIVTGQASSAVLRFEDGQVTALTANSRMQITAYQYNPQNQTGNVLLSLIDGGMRAITGLIGRRTPDNVAYRAASASIGIRGTDITIVTSAGNVVVTVAQGQISFRIGSGAPVIVNSGEGVRIRPGDTTAATGTIAAIVAQAARENPALGAIVQGVQNQLSGPLAGAIATAAATPSASSSQTQTIGVGQAATALPSGGTGGGATISATCSVSGTSAVCSCPAVSNGSFALAVSGTTGTCTLSCNSGFRATGASCVPGG